MIVFTMFFSYTNYKLISHDPNYLYAFFISGMIPAIEFQVLNYFKSGTITSDEKRREQNFHFSYNVKLLSYYNIYETSSQGLVHIAFGMWFGKIAPTICPELSFIYLWRLVWQVTFMLLVADLVNYFYHRYSHENRWLYANMHYLHHEHVQVVHSVFSLFFVHPIDMYLSNIAFFSGICVFETDLFTVFLFGSISSLITGSGHSGVVLKSRMLNYLLDPKFHQIHHEKFRYNFAENSTFVDKIFGTFSE